MVIPAHDEEDLVPACLTAVWHAARQLAIPVHVVVVADACTDRTAQRARDLGAAVVEISAKNVGAARQAGAGQILRRTQNLDPAAVWLATTDADTLVPRCWLARQLQFAAQGWQAVVGTVTVADWAGHPPHVPLLFDQRYLSGQGHHPHVHGANLGFSARAYLAAGGFKALSTGEDHDLVDAFVTAGVPVLRTAQVPVVTSARSHGRAPHGFARLLRTLAAPAGRPVPAPQQEPA